MDTDNRATGLWITLKAIPVEEVAKIAATLAQPETKPGDAVKRAYEILEMAVAAKLSLENCASFEKGIADQERAIETNKEFRAAIAVLPTDVSPPDRKPVPFDAAVTSFFPHDQLKSRIAKFERWLVSACGLSAANAKKKVTVMQRRGIPPNIYHHARLAIRDWWEQNKSEVRAVAGAKGQAAKKVKRPLK